MTRIFEEAGLRPGSGCPREHQVGQVIIADLAECGACDYDAAIAALVEYLKI